jgi:hypothetical protein
MVGTARPKILADRVIFPKHMPFIDEYRTYPWRILGFSNALMRPWKAFVPEAFYQSSFAVMHTYFLTNAYDYANKIDSKSPMRSAFDCYTWHCGASWIGPALIVDNVMRLCKRYTNRTSLAILASYASLAVCSPLLDSIMNWYFYGFWNAGNKERPRLSL